MNETLDLIEQELHRANTLMYENRNTLALHPELYRHQLNRIQAVVRTLQERIPQDGAQRVRVRAEARTRNPDDAFAGLRRHLGRDDLGAISVREGDVPLRRATGMPPSETYMYPSETYTSSSENLMDAEDEYPMTRKRQREEFGKRYRPKKH